MASGWLWCGSGAAPVCTSSPMEVSTCRWEHGVQPRSLAKSSLSMRKGRLGTGFSFIFNILPVSSPVCKQNLKSHPKPGFPGLSMQQSFANAALLLPKELQN